MNEALLILRLVFGLLFAAHGAQKLFGWFGGHGLAGVSGFFESLGFRPGRFFALAASLSETGGGLLIAAGLGGPIGPALAVAVMIVAAVTVHGKHGLFAANNGIELPLLYGTAGAALALSGPGAFSLDALLGFTALSLPAVKAAILILGIAGGALHVAARRPAAQVTV